MSVKDSGAHADIFPAVRFKALDYVFESSTSLKVMMELLALPAPYLTDTCDLYPHNGKLSEATFRTPWVREKVISSCKIHLSGSVLEDLRRTEVPVFLPERFIETDDDADQNQNNLRELPNSDLCQEQFLKCTPESMTPKDPIKDLLLAEELVAADHPSQLLRHLPKRTDMLSRLKMLPVEDPLLNSAGEPISADAMFSCFKKCESFEKPPDIKILDEQKFLNCEEFVKESLNKEDLLLLPDVVDMPELKSDHLTAFSNILGQMTFIPEHLEEEPPIIEVLQTVFPTDASMDISQIDLSEEYDKGDTLTDSLSETHLADRVTLPLEMELDLTMTPTSKKIQACSFPSISDLTQEPLSPPSKLSLVSAKAQEEMNMALWKAEKHPPFMARFMLLEPQSDTPTVDFRPLSEAMDAFKLQTESFTSPDDDDRDSLSCQHDTEALQQVLCSDRDLMESVKTDDPPIEKESIEEFQKLDLTDWDVGSHIPEKTPPIDVESLNIPTVGANSKEIEPDATTSTEEASVTGSVSSALSNVLDPNEGNNRTLQPTHCSEQSQNSAVSHMDHSRGQQPLRNQFEQDHDPLSTFIILRSQQAAAPSDAPHSPVRPTDVQVNRHPTGNVQTPGRGPAALGAIMTRSAIRKQNPDDQTTPEDRQSNTVVQVQATDSQRQAFCEILTFAQPCLTAARKHGLNFPKWEDFSTLTPDQTHFLLKQQERALYRTPERSPGVLKDKELLFNQAALMHVLVTLKELLLKCDLRTALGYLTKAAETCEELSLKQLLKRLNVIHYLNLKNQESNFKVLKMQQLLAEHLHSKSGQNITEKILVIISVDSDDSRSLIIDSLKHVTDLNVTAVFPKDHNKKLCGANVVSSLHHSAVVIVYEQHIGPDFPWSCFFLIVEYDHPGPSPWSELCKDKSISHLTFNTNIRITEEGDSAWCLQDNVPHVVIVTEGLLSCPLLLQTLESSCKVTVLERSHSSTLKILGSTKSFSVVTVDENTAILIQEEGELSRDRVSEALVMRLTTISLQYSYCWLILYCPHSHAGGFSSEAFTNLVLVYSSLVLFGMSEDFNVKVLIVSDVLELAKWIRQICFHSLMSSDRDSVSYLSRDWLSVLPSKDEMCLSQFHCINPMVSQLMLSKAPSLNWLLGASLSQLKDLLPEVSHKVLKMFSDITSLYQPNNTTVTETNPISPLNILRTRNGKPECFPEPHLLTCVSHLFGAPIAEAAFSEDTAESAVHSGSADFGISSHVTSQRSWTGYNPYFEEDKEEPWTKVPGWKSRAKAFGRDVRRTSDEQMASSNIFTPNSPLELHCFWQDSTGSHKSSDLTVYSEHLFPCDSKALGLPAAAAWNPGLTGNERVAGVSAVKSSTCWKGQERKRVPEDGYLEGSELVLSKKGRLSYERVPGRNDGQTRLRLF